MARSTSLVLVRHAHSSANERGVLAGRVPGVSLSEKGEAQAAELATALSELPISKILCSPLERCLETIAPFRSSLPRSKRPELVKEKRLLEMDYGTWSGQKLSRLAMKKEWPSIQSEPSRFTFPRGESFWEAQHRVISLIEEEVSSTGTIALVTHGDIIKMVLSHYLGAHLDEFQRIAIDPASISRLEFPQGRSAVVTLMNSTSHLIGKSGARGKHNLGGGAGVK